VLPLRPKGCGREDADQCPPARRPASRRRRQGSALPQPPVLPGPGARAVFHVAARAFDIEGSATRPRWPCSTRRRSTTRATCSTSTSQAADRPAVHPCAKKGERSPAVGQRRAAPRQLRSRCRCPCGGPRGPLDPARRPTAARHWRRSSARWRRSGTRPSRRSRPRRRRPTIAEAVVSVRRRLARGDRAEVDRQRCLDGDERDESVCGRSTGSPSCDRLARRLLRDSAKRRSWPGAARRPGRSPRAPASSCGRQRRSKRQGRAAQVRVLDEDQFNCCWSRAGRLS